MYKDVEGLMYKDVEGLIYMDVEGLMNKGIEAQGVPHRELIGTLTAISATKTDFKCTTHLQHTHTIYKLYPLPQ